MFADDTNLFISDPNLENLFETMNEELRKIATWFKVDKLSLDICKKKKKKIIYFILPEKKKRYTSYLTSIAH